MVSTPRGDMFHCPPLHAWQRDDLIVKGKEACKMLVVNATTSDFNPVESVVQNARTGFHATIRRSNDMKDPQYKGFSAHTKVRASIDEVAGFFELDTPHKVQAYARVMGEVVLDKRTLYTLVERPIADDASQPLHYVSVEWLMVKMPFGFNTRDMCYLEVHIAFL
ncbi:hypothetical protein DYB32_002826 [Aphanomyces invadans]|uniref:START domain-containing protein n=1 Tax=Aphanomyces invadans TaxID=157072 RepID=A0A418B271_9STRA|nr:hypothetical protein DYB32_002826 [Aphanomyces invadans]